MEEGAPYHTKVDYCNQQRFKKNRRQM